MYTVSTTIEGVAPLMQHRFPMPEFENLTKGGHKSTGGVDYTTEWIDYLYLEDDGQIYQPASHIEGALVKAAVNFKITGKRGKTYKDLFKAAVFVSPDRIPHVGFTFSTNGKKAQYKPDNVDTDGDKPLYIDMRPVIVNRARVVRMRPTFSPGWKLDFEIEVIDDEIQPGLLQDVLTQAGKAVGIGDYRPRFGRFNIAHFEVHK